MTLRIRLFLTSLLVAVPLAAGWLAIDTRMRLTTKEQELRGSLEADAGSGLRERCEADPPRTGRPGRGGGGAPRPASPLDGRGRGRNGGTWAGPGSGAYEYFAYDSTGRSTSNDAPKLRDDRDGTNAATYWAGNGFGLELVVPLAANGPCAIVLARLPPRPSELRDQLEALLLVVLSVLVAAWIAAGPVISRLRRLAEGVRRSAASHYSDPVPVEGPVEIAALATAFNEAGSQARAHMHDVQAREAALREFVANTTHDVAIPLTVLQGHLADLDRQLAGLPADHERVRAAMQEAHYMASLLRNLGAAITLEESRAPVVLSPVDLSALVERVVTRHRPIARAVNVELNLAVPDPPLAASLDLTLLEQALGNLVDNAIRYNRPGGHVAVLLDHAGDGFVLSVADDGPGVTEAELTQLTSRWFRGSDARTRRPDGKGLGLSIASESVKRLGLVLSFHRPAGGGLRAEIRSGAARAGGG